VLGLCVVCGGVGMCECVICVCKRFLICACGDFQRRVARRVWGEGEMCTASSRTNSTKRARGRDGALCQGVTVVAVVAGGLVVVQ
jgi:hypothetical protein